MGSLGMVPRPSVEELPPLGDRVASEAGGTGPPSDFKALPNEIIACVKLTSCSTAVPQPARSTSSRPSVSAAEATLSTSTIAGPAGTRRGVALG